MWERQKRVRALSAPFLLHAPLNITEHSCYSPLRRPYENWPKVGRQQKPICTITDLFIPALFFSNGRISETKQDFVNALVAKRHPRTGLSPTLSWKWPRPTLSSSFGLFLERKHFFGVFQLGQSGPLWSKTCPQDPSVSPKKNLVAGSYIKRFPP